MAGPNPHTVLPNKTPASTLEEYRGDPNFMMTLARGLIVIQALARQERKRTIVKLSCETGLSSASVRRCLYTLTRLDFADSGGGPRGYTLRPHRFEFPIPAANPDSQNRGQIVNHKKYGTKGLTRE